MGDYEQYFAISNWTRELFIDEFRIPADRINTISLDCDRTIFQDHSENRKEVLSSFGLPDRPFFVHVSSGDKRKNYQGVLNGFSQLAHRSREIVLIRIGSPLHEANRKAEQEYIREKKLGGRVFSLSGLSDQQLASLYRVSDGLVFPSFAEGFGLPVLEAQACGCPVITSRNSALTEVMGPLSIEVDPKDTESIAFGMETLLNNQNFKLSHKAENERFLQKFSWNSGRKLIRSWLQFH
jgi:glycosyltransferase involved in cell wall biosynthesis